VSIQAEISKSDRALWRSVISQAIDDASANSVGTLKIAGAVRAIREAQSWLFHPNKDFEVVCEWADVCPRQVRTLARKRIELHWEKADNIAVQYAAQLKQRDQLAEVRRQASIDAAERTHMTDAERQAHTKVTAEVRAERATNHPGQLYTHNGLSLTIMQWSQRLSLSDVTLRNRLRKGLPLDQVFTPELIQKPVFLTHAGETMRITEWSKRTGISLARLRDRLSKGFSVERALTQPPRRAPTKVKARGGGSQLSANVSGPARAPAHETAAK
jgi:hypothetical protein